MQCPSSCLLISFRASISFVFFFLSKTGYLNCCKYFILCAHKRDCSPGPPPVWTHKAHAQTSGQWNGVSALSPVVGSHVNVSGQAGTQAGRHPCLYCSGKSRCEFCNEWDGRVPAVHSTAAQFAWGLKESKVNKMSSSHEQQKREWRSGLKSKSHFQKCVSWTEVHWVMLCILHTSSLTLWKKTLNSAPTYLTQLYTACFVFFCTTSLSPSSLQHVGNHPPYWHMTGSFHKLCNPSKPEPHHRLRTDFQQI